MALAPLFPPPSHRSSLNFSPHTLASPTSFPLLSHRRSLRNSFLAPSTCRRRARLGPLPPRLFLKGAPVGWGPFQTGKTVAPGRRSGNGSRFTASTWLENTAQIEIDIPLSEAWDLWVDREQINRWMPWIHSIKVLKDRPELSEWVLRYEAFGQNLEFKWTARNLQPIYHQKIHWRSVDGLPNRGVVRFYPRGPSSVGLQLTISYEVPEILAGFIAPLSPFVESIIQQDLERFAAFVKSNKSKASVK